MSKKSIVDNWQLEDSKYDRLEQELIDKGFMLPTCPIEKLWAEIAPSTMIPNLVQDRHGRWVEIDVLAEQEPETYKKLTEDMVKKSRFYVPPKDPSDDWDPGQG